MELLEKLGVDWKLLIAQILNFLILLGVLYKFLYKPVLSKLDERTKRIGESLDKADKIDADFKTSSVKNEALLKQAKLEAASIIADAQAKGEKMYQEKLEQTATEAKQIVERAKQMLEDEKGRLLQQAKTDIADLVVRATGKVLEGGLTKEMNDRLVSNILKTVK